MDAPGSTKSQLPAPHTSGGDGAVWMNIHLDGTRKLSAVIQLHIEEIAMRGVTLEIDHVNAAVRVNGDLRLDAAIGCSEHGNSPRVRPTRLIDAARAHRTEPQVGGEEDRAGGSYHQ